MISADFLQDHHHLLSRFFRFPSFLFFVSVETQDLIQVRGDVIELQVLNGTHWLNLGGNVETFEAVIAVPPETSSQVTLLQALTKLNQVRKCISTREKKLLLCCIFHALLLFCFADFRSSRQHQSFNTVSTKDSFIFLFAHTATIFKGKKILLHSTPKIDKMFENDEKFEFLDFTNMGERRDFSIWCDASFRLGKTLWFG